MSRSQFTYSVIILGGGGLGDDYLDYAGGVGVPNWAKVDNIICACSLNIIRISFWYRPYAFLRVKIKQDLYQGYLDFNPNKGLLELMTQHNILF